MSEEMKAEKETTAPRSAPQSNTVKYVVIGVAVLLILGYGSRFVTGMIGGAVMKTELKANGITVTGNPSNGNATYNYKDEKGNTATIGTGTKLPDDFPKDVPVYKGTILSSTAATQDNKKMFMVSIETTDTFDTVVGYYKSGLASNGWKITQESNLAAGYSMFAAENGTLQLNAMLQGADGKTIVTLSAGAKE